MEENGCWFHIFAQLFYVFEKQLSKHTKCGAMNMFHQSHADVLTCHILHGCLG